MKIGKALRKAARAQSAEITIQRYGEDNSNCIKIDYHGYVTIEGAIHAGDLLGADWKLNFYVPRKPEN